MNALTVKEFVDTSEIGLRLVAGFSGGDNVISNVNIMDNPDTFDWLSPGDFLLTSGYILKDDPALQINAVRELADINCAGLGIKTHRYLEQVPQGMVEEADRLGLPIVEIPYQCSLAQVSTLVHQRTMQQEELHYKKIVHIHNTLTQCSLEGGGLDEISKLVSSLIGNPILVVDRKWRLLACADREGNPKPMADYLNLTRREYPFSLEFVQDIPVNMEKLSKSVKRRYPNGQGDVLCRILPVAVGLEIYGYLVVWETMQKMTAVEYVALESAATAVALERVKARQIEEIKHRLRNDFFDDLLQGRIESISAVNSLAEIHNLDASKTYICMVARLSDPGECPEQETERRNRMAQVKEHLVGVTEWTARNWGRNVVSIHRGNRLISFIRVLREELEEKCSRGLRDFVQDCYECMSKRAEGFELRVGIGRPCPEFIQMQKSYLQAQEALRIAAAVDRERRVSFYEDIMVYHLLDCISSREVLLDFYQASIGRLVDYDVQNGTELSATLEQFFLCHGNITTAAKKMFLHRNTFIYRMDKIKSILDTELKDPEELLELQLALHILKIRPELET